MCSFLHGRYAYYLRELTYTKWCAAELCPVHIIGKRSGDYLEIIAHLIQKFWVIEQLSTLHGPRTACV